MARAAAAAIVRAELAAACPAPEKLAQEEPALQLPEDVLQLARRLAAVAEQSIARISAYSPSAGSLEVGCEAFALLFVAPFLLQLSRA